MRAERVRWVPPGVFAVGCLLLLTVNRQRIMPLAAPLSTLPTQLLGYRSEDIPIDKAEQRVAGMSSYMLRTFERDSAFAFSVYVGYYEYQTQGKSIHSPKNCLPGAGWETLSASERGVNVNGAVFPINRYLLAKGRAKAMVYYWYQGRGRVAADEYRVKWNLLRDVALTGRSEEALVRIVVPIQDAQEQMADTLAERVASQLIPRVAAVLPT